MKTNPLLLLTTALLLSGASLHANENLFGGAAAQPPVLQGMISDPLGVVAALSRAAQAPVLQGLVTDPLGLPPPPSSHQNPAIARLDQLDEASIIAILIGMLHGNDGDDTLQDFFLWAALTGPTQPAPHGIESDPFGLWGGGGTDSITGDGGDDVLPRLQHAVLLIYGEGGADSLYGGSGADTLVRKLAHFVVGNTGADRFTCDPLDEDTINGDLGNDTLRPTNRMARLQQVAFSLGARSDVVYLSNVIGGGDADF
ncbi:MAG: hypothetical protein ABL974_14170 [Prosthecobacter sp.]